MFFAKRYLSNAYIFVFVLILLCGSLATYSLYQEEKQRIRYEQNIAGERFSGAVFMALNNYSIEVMGLAAFFQASMDKEVSPQAFTAYSQRLVERQFNPILNTYFAQYIQPQDVATFLQTQRALTKNPYMTLIPQGQRAEYLPLAYGFPDVILHGTDLLSEDLPYRASVLQARQSKMITMTPPTALAKDNVSGNAKRNAFILRQALFDDTLAPADGFQGIVGIAFKIEGLLSQIDYLSYQELAYRFADVTHLVQEKTSEQGLSKGSEPEWFLDSHVSRQSDWQTETIDRHTFQFGSRTWLIETHTNDGLIARFNWTLLLVPFFSFLVLAIFLSRYVRRLTLAYQGIVNQAHEALSTDELTQLNSRYEMNQQLTQMIADAKIGQQCVVMLLDLDHFKTINDAFGHETGDKLLAKVAQRLPSVFPNEVILGRLGGDEFIAVLPCTYEEHREHTISLAKEVIHQISQSYFIDDRILTIGCSIGLAMYPEFGSDATTLIKNADMALYEAKKMGRSAYHFYDGGMGLRLARNVRIETRLRLAMQNHQLELYFQPKVDLKSYTCIGLEALLRWHDEELGSVSPVEFIPIAEQTGIILPLGEWVIQQTCCHIAKWREQGLTVPPVAINCSAAQLRREDFFNRLLCIIDEYAVEASLIELEVTESILIEDAESCAKLLRQVSRLGMKLAMDDFGTGYSSLSYLKDLPFDCVKIDQVFIRDIIEDENHAALTRAIIQMSHSLNLQVVAEGITNQQQLTLLQSYGCDIGQGFFFGEAFHADRVAGEIGKTMHPSLEGGTNTDKT